MGGKLSKGLRYEGNHFRQHDGVNFVQARSWACEVLCERVACRGPVLPSPLPSPRSFTTKPVIPAHVLTCNI